MSWITTASSNCGSRSENQDSVDVRLLKAGRENYVTAVCCDGIGSRPRSGQTADDTCRLVQRTLSDLLSRGKAKQPILNPQRLCSFISQKLSYSLPANPAAGTTCVAVVNDDRYWASMSVGDSRAYRLTDTGELIQISQDGVNDDGELTSFILGDGKTVGKWSCCKGKFTSRSACICVMTDGVYAACSDEELRQFLIFCVSQIRSDHSLTTSLQQFLGANASDNFSMALACNRKMIRKLRSRGSALMQMREDHATT